jgi:hypothetical protein
MIVTYYSHSKNTHNLKDMEFEISKTSKMFIVDFVDNCTFQNENEIQGMHWHSF